MKKFEMAEAQETALVNETMEVLKDRGWEPEYSAVKKLIRTWKSHKAKLLSILCNHPLWDENGCYVHFDSDYTREMDKDEIRAFFVVFLSAYLTEEVERTRSGDEEFSENLVEVVRKIEEKSNYLTRYYGSIDNVEPEGLLDRSYCRITVLTDHLYSVICNNGNSIITEECVNEFKDLFDINPRAGQKISRYVNKVLTMIGLDKAFVMRTVHDAEGNPKQVKYTYQQAFAKFADAMNPIKYTRHTVISLNPIDYLLMSNGNSWASCHTIDRNDDRPNNYDGCYCGGTVSYMLDGTSLVYYTVDKAHNGSHMELADKVTRQMFHYDDYKLVQARLYPQSNDGSASNNLRKEIREIVQKVFADSLELPNSWVHRKTEDCARDYMQTGEYAANYEDYFEYTTHLSYCKVLPEGANENIFEDRIYIGATRIDIGTGEEIHSYDDKETLSLTSKGVYCEWEDEYHPEDECTWVESVNSYVSEYCLDEQFYRCEDCGDFFLLDDMFETANCRSICRDCYESYYDTCEECNGIYHNDDTVYVEERDEYMCRDCYEAYLEEKAEEEEEEKRETEELDEVI